MQYIKLKDQPITLVDKVSIFETTPTKAIFEAIQFCKDNDLTDAELIYKGFTLSLSKDSELADKVEDYYKYLDLRL